MIPYPGKQSEAYFLCLRAGEKVYSTAVDILTGDDIWRYWDLVDKADYEESAAFVGFDVFRSVHYTQADSNNTIDGTWVRTWKFTKERGWFVKSRLSGRGFLDAQRFDIQRNSSTASRLSQRMIISIGQQLGFN